MKTITEKSPATAKAPSLNLKLIASREILHTSETDGERIVRVECIQHGDECKFTEVSFWAQNGKITRVTAAEKSLLPIWAIDESRKTATPQPDKKFLRNDTTAGKWVAGRVYCTVETDGDGYMVSGQPEDGFKTIKAATAYLKSFLVPSWAVSTSVATGNGTIKKWVNRGYISKI